MVRLDAFLKNSEKVHSRSAAVGVIESGRVIVNGRIAKKPSLLVCQSDSIVVVAKDESWSTEPVVKTDIDTTALLDDPIWASLKVIDEQNGFMVLNKPSGIVVHSTAKSEDKHCLSTWLARVIPSSEAPGLGRGGVVHRLDKETSGLLLVAKNAESQARLSSLFLTRQIRKTYLALLVGHSPREGRIDFSIGRDVSRRERWTINGIGAKPAISHFKTIAWFCRETKSGNAMCNEPLLQDSAIQKTCQREGCSQIWQDRGTSVHFSLVRFEIETGRTHQIRVHSRAIGHPVLGDVLYGKKSDLITRQALHAERLEFALLDKMFFYRAPLSQDIKQLIPENTLNLIF